MIALCPTCWQVAPPAAECCPACGADFAALQEREYTEKLIGALDRPDRKTMIRVARILGARGDERTVSSLVRALRRYSSEPYVAAAIIESLGRLPGAAARTAVRDGLGHESVIVREKATLALALVAASRWRQRGALVPPRFALAIAWQDGLELSSLPAQRC